MAHKITKYTRVILVLFGFFVTHSSIALNCNLDSVGGSLPTQEDYDVLIDRIVSSDFTLCANGACNFDGDTRTSDPADVGDAAALLLIVQSGSDPGGVCETGGGGGNQPPVGGALSCAVSPVNPNWRNCALSSVSDADGHSTSCEMTCYAGQEVFTNLNCLVGATCMYPSIGSYETVMTPKDSQGLYGSPVSTTVTLTEFVNHAPSVNFSCMDNIGTTPLTTTCGGNSPTDTDGDTVSCAVSCGNGTTPTPTSPGCTQQFTCQYLDPGPYTITMTPTDNRGLAGQSKTVSVMANQPANFICGNGTVETGENCDDGNTVTEACAYGLTSCNVCGSGCQTVPGSAVSYCGDGVVQSGNEQCDFGDALSGDGCSSTCQNEIPPYTTPSFSLRFGTGVLNNPRDLDINPATGNVFVADQSNNRVVEFNPTTGAMVATIGPTLSVGVTLSGPEAVCFSPVSSRWAIVDQDHARVIVMSSSSQISHVVGGFGQGQGQFDRPQGCVFDQQDNLFVVDDTTQVGNTVNHRIEKFSPTGSFLMEWGGYGTENGKFNRPGGITIDSDNYLYVVDTLNYRIQKFTTSGVFVLKWGSPGSAPGQFSLPGYIDIGPNKKVYVMEFGLDIIQVYTQSGVFLGSIGQSGSADGQFEDTLGIEVSQDGKVFTSDFTRDDIQLFSP